MNERTIEVPFASERDGEGDGLTLEGYASVFNSPAPISDLDGEYDEVILPGAFARTIRAKTPSLMFNHGKNPLWQNMPIGRVEELREDTHGLFVRAKLTDNWLIHPIRDAIRDGAVTGMSFRFSVPEGKATKTRQDNGRNLVKIREVKLFELGPVTSPAYAETSVAVRSLETAVPDAIGIDTSEALARLEELRERLDALTTETSVNVVVRSPEPADSSTSEELVREDTSDEPAAPRDPAPSHSPSTAEERRKFARKALNDELFSR